MKNHNVPQKNTAALSIFYLLRQSLLPPAIYPPQSHRKQAAILVPLIHGLYSQTHWIICRGVRLPRRADAAPEGERNPFNHAGTPLAHRPVPENRPGSPPFTHLLLRVSDNRSWKSIKKCFCGVGARLAVQQTREGTINPSMKGMQRPGGVRGAGGRSAGSSRAAENPTSCFASACFPCGSQPLTRRKSHTRFPQRLLLT